MTKRHWHWEFLAFNGELNGDKIHWGVAVRVIGYLCEADARIAAKDIIQREHYELRSVSECNTCGFQQSITGAMTEMAKNSK